MARPSGPFYFDPDEVAVLEMACRLADERALLEEALAATQTVVTGSQGQPVVNGLFGELRLNRQAQARLLGQLALPRDDTDAARPMTARQRQASRAAQSRWARSAEVREIRRGQAG